MYNAQRSSVAQRSRKYYACYVAMSLCQTDRCLPSQEDTSPLYSVYVLIGWFSSRRSGSSSRTKD